jgi:hypothetical protein
MLQVVGPKHHDLATPGAAALCPTVRNLSIAGFDPCDNRWQALELGHASRDA